MFAETRALVDLAQRQQPGFRRGLIARSLVWVVSESLLLVLVLEGLERKRDGLSTYPEFVLFLVAMGCYVWGQRLLLLFAGAGYIRLARAMIEDIALRLHRLPLLEFEGLERGTLLTQLIGDGNRVAGSGRSLVYAVTSGMRLVFAIFFVMAQSAVAAVIAMVVSALVVLVGVSQLRLMTEGFVGIARAEAKLFDLLRDQLRGALLVRLHGPRARSIARAYRELVARLRELRVDIWSRNYERQYASNALIYGLLGVNVFILPLVVPTSDEAIREVNMALLWLLFSLVQLVFILPQLAESGKAAERLQALRDQLAEERLEPVAPPVGRGRLDGFRGLELDALEFRYRSTATRDGFAVGPVSVRLGRGELVFVTGHNGSGKSTFLKMLTGLYAADVGCIRVDGEVVGPHDLADYRALFGTIFVDHTLFARVHGMRPEDEPRAAALLEELGIAGKTAIEGGRLTRRDLSTGQKKRLAMALTRLRDRPIMVFDEWAADQDPGFREYYYQQLLPALRDAGKLVIVVTHDDQHFGLADRTIHFTGGRAHERGVPA
jgi:putative ATP-binding cassette transporter